MIAVGLRGVVSPATSSDLLSGGLDGRSDVRRRHIIRSTSKTSLADTLGPETCEIHALGFEGHSHKVPPGRNIHFHAWGFKPSHTDGPARATVDEWGQAQAGGRNIGHIPAAGRETNWRFAEPSCPDSAVPHWSRITRSSCVWRKCRRHRSCRQLLNQPSQAATQQIFLLFTQENMPKTKHCPLRTF